MPPRATVGPGTSRAWPSGAARSPTMTTWESSQPSQAARIAGLEEVLRSPPANVVLVTNEVGMGIVPENALAREYRDLVGRLNQSVAQASDEVVLMTSGIALKIK